MKKQLIRRWMAAVLTCAMCLSTVQLSIYAEPAAAAAVVRETVEAGYEEIDTATDIVTDCSQEEIDIVGSESDEDYSETEEVTTEEVTVVENVTESEITETEMDTETEADTEEHVNAGLPVPEQEMENINDLGELGLADINLPSSYIPGLSEVPLPRNQGSLGTCYAFASIGAIEANMIKKGMSPNELDYSELATAYFTTNTVTDSLGGTAGDRNRYSDDELSRYRANGKYDDVEGGNPIFVAPSLAAWIGANDEALAPYSSASIKEKVVVDDSVAYDDMVHIQGWRKASLKNDRDGIKMLIQEFGGATLAYAASSFRYMGTDRHSYYNYNDEVLNHFVTVVGWDDNYSKDKFDYSSRRPAGNGAWLVRNSWDSSPNTGTTIEENYSGSKFFWISYYDKALENAFAFDVENADNYDHNYQYDLVAASDYPFGESNSSKAANIFTAKACDEGEYLKAISFETNGVTNMEYTVMIYLNPDDENPESGELIDSATTIGKTSHIGYYTVELEEPVYVKKGEKYSVVVEVNKQKSTPGISVEKKTSYWFTTEIGISPGCSFYYYNNKWNDMYNYNRSYYGNVKIKAFTDDATDSDVLDIDPDVPKLENIKAEYNGVATELEYGDELGIEDFYVTRTMSTYYPRNNKTLYTTEDVDVVAEKDNITITPNEVPYIDSNTLKVKVTYCYADKEASDTILINLAGADGKMMIKFKDGTDECYYTGIAIKPALEVYYKGQLLTEKKDYVVAYKNNVNVYELTTSEPGFDAKKAPTITVTGKGDFKQSISTTFTIKPKDVGDDDIVANVVGVKTSPKCQKPVPVVKNGTKTLVKNNAGAFTPANGKYTTLKDMTITYLEDENDPESVIPEIPANSTGTYYIRIEGTNNYKGERIIPVNVGEVLLSSAKVNTLRFRYTGKELDIKNRMTVTVTLKGKPYNLKEDEYDVSPVDTVSVGSRNFTITSKKDGVVGSKSVKLEIVGKALSSVANVSTMYDKSYTGNAICPTPRVYYKRDEYKSLKRGTDYTVEYLNNLNVGKATVIIKGINGYTGQLSTTFKIIPRDISYVTIEMIDNSGEPNTDKKVPYTRTGAIPKFKVMDGGKQLENGKDYKVTCSRNTTVSQYANTALYKITMKGNYTGNTLDTFTVISSDFADVGVKATATDITYGNKISKSKITLTDGDGKALRANVDYDTKMISYSLITEFDEHGMPVVDENSYASSTVIPQGYRGIYVVIPAKGNYTGTVSTWFRVSDFDISKASATTKVQSYLGGDEVKPGSAVFSKLEYRNGKEVIPLEEGVDYEIIDYKDNCRRGTAKVIIRGLDRFCGTKSINFTIGANSFVTRLMSLF